ncbi:MAG: porin family protein [Chitinophagaceae bacterium]
MKSKLIIFLVAFSLMSAVSFAQKTPFLQAGIKAGTNITKIDGKSFKEEFRFGYSFGGFAAIKVGEKWQVQPEVLFNQYNTKTASNFDTIVNGQSLKNISLNYISIPILLNYSPTKMFTLQAGPQFGILRDKSQDLLQNGKSAFKSGDFSMLGGVQLNVANFKISGRYVVGLSDINDINNQDKWTSQGFQLSVGLRIL